MHDKMVSTEREYQEACVDTRGLVDGPGSQKGHPKGIDRGLIKKWVSCGMNTKIPRTTEAAILAVASSGT